MTKCEDPCIHKYAHTYYVLNYLYHLTFYFVVPGHVRFTCSNIVRHAE